MQFHFSSNRIQKNMKKSVALVENKERYENENLNKMKWKKKTRRNVCLEKSLKCVEYIIYWSKKKLLLYA